MPPAAQTPGLAKQVGGTVQQLENTLHALSGLVFLGTSQQPQDMNLMEMTHECASPSANTISPGTESPAEPSGHHVQGSPPEAAEGSALPNARATPAPS